MAREVGKSRVEMTMLEFLFFALAFSCTLLVWLCCINKCLGIVIFNGSASKNKSIVYQGDFTRQNITSEMDVNPKHTRSRTVRDLDV